VCAIVTITLAACGGGTPYKADKAVTVVAREQGSGTKSAFMEILSGLSGANLTAAEYDNTSFNSTAAVLNAVKSNGNAIGYDSLGYVTKTVKAISVDGKAPTVANIISGDYKLSRPLSVVYKAAGIGVTESPTAQQIRNNDFYNFLLSTEGRKVISDEGYVNFEREAAAYSKSTGLATGTIKVGGSTSFEPLMRALADKYKSLANGSGVTITIDFNISNSGGGLSGANATDSTELDFGMISNTTAVGGGTSYETLAKLEVAKDGIAVIVNKKNPITNVKSSVLMSLYFQAGKTAGANCLAGNAHVVGERPTSWEKLIEANS